MPHKKFILGQYFTRKLIAKKLVELLLKYADCDRNVRILEPSFGKGSFIQVLKERGFMNIEGCEIDPKLTAKPSDFFDLPLERKFELIIGNPPFTKFNLDGSYYYKERYAHKLPKPDEYLVNSLADKKRIRIENAFILKSLMHLKDEDSTIAFILPISFF
ncbi:hypothetical protein COV61_01175, partial [Candidatus Micrarchaeota archaeon CG11_big_fil_rev_8_21_14_0_20_47_5]